MPAGRTGYRALSGQVSYASPLVFTGCGSNNFPCLACGLSSWDNLTQAAVVVGYTSTGGVAQAFALAGTSRTVGALSFAYFAKGGYDERLR
jgi:hypothetical protein